MKAQISGLKPYTNYSLWCRAIDANGDVSRSTRPLHFITEQEGEFKNPPLLLFCRKKIETPSCLFVYFVLAPSSPPLGIQASATSIAAVSVSWDPPLQTNGPITVMPFLLTNPKAQLFICPNGEIFLEERARSRERERERERESVF